jgi:hypothetical protein
MRAIEVENSTSNGHVRILFNGFVIAIGDKLGAAFLQQLSAARLAESSALVRIKSARSSLFVYFDARHPVVA